MNFVRSPKCWSIMRFGKNLGLSRGSFQTVPHWAAPPLGPGSDCSWLGQRYFHRALGSEQQAETQLPHFWPVNWNVLEAPCYSSLPSFGLGPYCGWNSPLLAPLPSLAPTLDVAVAGPATLLLMGPVEALAATFTVAPVGVVSAMQATEAVPGQPEQLPIEHALPRLAVALTHCGQDRRGVSMKTQSLPANMWAHHGPA